MKYREFLLIYTEWRAGEITIRSALEKSADLSGSAPEKVYHNRNNSHKKGI